MNTTEIIITKEGEPLLHGLITNVSGINDAYLLSTPEGNKALLQSDTPIRCKDCIASKLVKESTFCDDLVKAGLSLDDRICTDYYENELPVYVPENGFCHNAIKPQSSSKKK